MLKKSIQGKVGKLGYFSFFQLDNLIVDSIASVSLHMQLYLESVGLQYFCMQDVQHRHSSLYMTHTYIKNIFGLKKWQD